MMMTFEDFKNEVKNNISSYLPGSFETESIDIRKVIKNNGISLTALTIMEKGNPVAPTIYLDQYYVRYMNGDNLGKLLEEIACIRMDKTTSFCHLEDFNDFDWVRTRILPELVNADRNRELLETIPHRIYGGDLAVIFKATVDDAGLGAGKLRICNSHMNIWGVDTDSLWKNALQNMREKGYSFMGMADVLLEMGLDIANEEESFNAEMYILTNWEKAAGAGLMTDTDILDEICDRLNDNLIILPSSIHEVIILPMREKGTDISCLADMVAQINSTVLATEEILSDSVYAYRKGQAEITKIG